MKALKLDLLTQEVSSESEPGWMQNIRQAAAIRFQKFGFPNRRVENWKYSSMAAWSDKSFVRPELVEADKTAIKTDSIALYFVDGVLDETQSDIGNLPDSLELQTYAQAIASGDTSIQAFLETDHETADLSLNDLNTAIANQGVVIRVHAPVMQLLELHFHSTPSPALSAVRNMILLEESTSLSLVEHHSVAPGSEGLFNLVNQAMLKPGAKLEHMRVQQKPEQFESSARITRTEIHQMANSQYHYHGLDLGGEMVRHDIHVQLKGEEAECRLLGAYAISDQSHVDNHLRVDHIAQNCRSEEIFRGVLDGQSKAVFNGKVIVHEGADGSDAQQSNGNLMLSRQAEVDTKPELEIYADDVVCSHGATVGQLDENALFYLRARGIDEQQARKILMQAFCQAALDSIPDESVAEYASAQLSLKLTG